MNREQRRRAQREGVPAAVLKFVTAYTCADCLSSTAWPFRDHRGTWWITVGHDDSCPVLRGQVSPVPEVSRAAGAAGAAGALILARHGTEARR